MKRTTYLMSKVVVVAALAAGAVGVANADMGRFDSGYQYFARQPIDKAPSAWRKDHPNGLSAQQLQADSTASQSEAFKVDKPVIDTARSDFRLTHPNGHSELELQALSSPGPAWHTQPAPKVVTSSGQTDVTQGAGKETFAARAARIFHPAKQDAQAR